MNVVEDTFPQSQLSASSYKNAASCKIAQRPVNMPQQFRFKLFDFEEIKPLSRLNPHARSGHRLVADDDGNLYSFGGYNVQVPSDDRELYQVSEWIKFRPLFQELWRFSWRTKKWTKLLTTGDIPDKLVSHCMGYWQGKIIIYGGTGMPFGENSSNKLSIYNIAKNYWETIEPLSDPSQTPVELYGQAMAIDEQNDDVYVVGGTTGAQYSLDVHKFNLFTKRWTVLYKSTMSYETHGCRYRHEIAFYNKKLFVFGGSTDVTFYAFHKLPVFNLETRDWSWCETQAAGFDEPRYPAPCKAHSLTMIGTDVYICGGTTGKTICPDLWHLDLKTMKWILLVKKIPHPVYFHGACISLNGKLSIFGGIEKFAGLTRNDKLTTIWLKIPTLKILCSTAVNYYIENKVIDAGALTQTGFEPSSNCDELWTNKNDYLRILKKIFAVN